MSVSAEEIRKMSPEERLKLLNELRMELLKLRTQAQLGVLKNVARIKIVKKNIARILTVMREEELKARVRK
ncbi:MAG: 50S ribosomal protein L29 [Zestosphaera tikiterensis]|uniref:Large ribosomal subunit protein uL29 n=1 Tax=Zestosphaera tikiterensis TaxID=1973259 RepID=A0A2R7Y798_9CREN|nr:MAG: 50S ribosomal protein L29 [Zestosphaera tikiterensis]